MELVPLFRQERRPLPISAVRDKLVKELTPAPVEWTAMEVKDPPLIRMVVLVAPVLRGKVA